MSLSKRVETDFFIHPGANCESGTVGPGTRIWGTTHVLRDARIGRDCNIGEGVYIENQVTIGDRCTIKNGVSLWDRVTLESDVFIGPNAVFTNDLRPRAFVKRAAHELLPTNLRRGATIGANAVVVCGITIGEFAMIGAGAVVTRDVPAHGLVLGNPGRLVGRVCYCGDRLAERDFCPTCRRVLSENSYDFVANR